MMKTSLSIDDIWDALEARTIWAGVKSDNAAKAVAEKERAAKLAAMAGGR